MNALELLKQDHQEMSDLLEATAQADDQDEREQLFNKTAAQLEIHAFIEEKIFYPALARHNLLKDMVAEALEEHQEVRDLLDDVAGLDASSDEFESQVELLIAWVEDHVANEEREMFPKILECFDAMELENLGRRLEAAKGAQESQTV